MVDASLITPNDYQTAYAGEPGNYFRRVMGSPKETCLRHVEEAHSAFGRADARDSGVEGQQRSLIDTANIEEIRQASEYGLVDGVTTNPSLVAKEGGDFFTVIKEISQAVAGPVSVGARDHAPARVRQCRALQFPTERSRLRGARPPVAP